MRQRRFALKNVDLMRNTNSIRLLYPRFRAVARRALPADGLGRGIQVAFFKLEVAVGVELAVSLPVVGPFRGPPADGLLGFAETLFPGPL